MSKGTDPIIERQRQVFLLALEQPTPAERERYLESACGDDKALRAEVELLLEHHGDSSFLQRPAVESMGTIATGNMPVEAPGTMIGRYKLLEKIGEGGCGVVYMAEQEEPVRRKVALKIIKLGMDTKSVIARFEAERQALALMDHPNIARVLDAGANDAGRPYFVMELVGGIRITDYCEQNQLTTRQRLDLFIQVCRAVQHAHQKGIIHRDLKPSNVLVATQDGVAVPKVIDFGIAKATQGRLTKQTVFTAFEQFLGTPAYMSPEQAQLGGLDVDTRSDIYSLGVLLYELLTGKTPFDAKELLATGLEAMRRTICEKEPPTPSTRLKQEEAAQQAQHSAKSKTQNLKSKIAADLDWIVMKCLEKDRGRRYETANGLARDIERHLNNEPVVAGPPSNLYRLQKLAKRNKVLFAATGAVVLALVLGLGLSAWMFFRERAGRREQARLRQDAENAQASEQKAREKAQQEATKSQQVAQFLTDMLQGVGPAVAMGRDTTMLREILDRTSERIGKELTNQPAVQIELLVIVSEIYLHLALYKQAEAAAQESLRLAQANFRGTNATIAAALNLAGAVQSELGDYTQAESNLRSAVAMLRSLYGNENRDTVAALVNLGLLLHRAGKLPESVEAYEEAISLSNKSHRDETPEDLTILCNFGNVLGAQGKFPEAEKAHRRVLEQRRKLLGNDHPDIALSLNGLALIVGQQGKYAEAEAFQREALEVQQKVLGKEHHQVAISLFNISSLLREQGKFPEAESLCREAVAMGRKVLGDSHADVAGFIGGLGLILQAEGKFTDARAAHEEALAIRRRVNGNESREVAASLNNIGIILSQESNYAEAEKRFREAMAILDRLFGKEHPQAATVRVNLARVLINAEKPKEAEILSREAIAIYQEVVGNDHPDLAHALSSLGQSLADQGKLVDAEGCYSNALAIERKVFGLEHPNIAASLNSLARNMLDQGKYAEAEPIARESHFMNQKILGERHPHLVYTINTLALALQMQDKSAEVEALLRDDLSSIRERVPADHLQLGVALHHFAVALLKQGKFGEAEPPARESLDIARKQIPTAWQTFSFQGDLGAVLLGQKKYAAAEPELLASYTGMKQREATIPIQSKRVFKESLERLVQFYEITGKTDQAGEWRKALDDIDGARTNRAAPTPQPKP